MTTTVDAQRGDCWVMTFKEGLLSAVAHDLKLRVARWSATWDADARRIEATFDAGSLEVVCAMADGREARGTLKPRDTAKIAKNIVNDVLHARRHPAITFASTAVEVDGDTARVEGELTLHGRTRPIEATARRSGARWVTEVSLHQPDFGITPYSAMFGTLKVRPDVTVRLELPAAPEGGVA